MARRAIRPPETARGLRHRVLRAEEREGWFDQQAEKLLGEALDAFVVALQETGITDDDAARFRKEYDRAKSRVEITNQTGIHSFRIYVRMPGEVVGHNGDEERDGAILWEFDGKAFRDRAHEITITSRVPKGR